MEKNENITVHGVTLTPESLKRLKAISENYNNEDTAKGIFRITTIYAKNMIKEDGYWFYL